MCGNPFKAPKAPKAPPAPPEPAQMADEAVRQRGRDESARRRRQGRASTIRTSQGGLGGEATTTQKTLLGG